LLGYAPVAQHDDQVGPADPVEAVADDGADARAQFGYGSSRMSAPSQVMRPRVGW
jgi:hypothetical protein